MAHPDFFTPVQEVNTQSDKALDEIGQQIVAGIAGLPLHLVWPLGLPHPPPQPEPDVNWCGVGVNVMEVEYTPVTGMFDGGVTPGTIERHERIPFHCVFYGPDAVAYAARLREGMFLAHNRSLIQTHYGLYYYETSPITRIPDYVNTQWINRADITFTSQFKDK